MRPINGSRESRAQREWFAFELVRVPLPSNAVIPCFNNFSAFFGPPRVMTLNFLDALLVVGNEKRCNLIEQGLDRLPARLEPGSSAAVRSRRRDNRFHFWNAP